MTHDGKRVRFFSGPNEEIQSNCDGDRLAELWLCASEFKAIRMESKLIAYQSCQSSKAQLLDGVFVDVEDAPLEVQEKMNLWSMHAHSRRGLEAQISQRLNHDRRMIKECVWRTVFEAQDKLRVAKGSDDEKAEIIATLCSLQSLRAIQIASMMGRSDYIASMDSRILSPPRVFSAPQFRRSLNSLRAFAMDSEPRIGCKPRSFPTDGKYSSTQTDEI